MAINRVDLRLSDGSVNTLIDLSGDTVTENDLPQGVTAHGADGELVTGTIKEGSPSHKVGTPSYSSNIYTKLISIKATSDEDAIIRSGSEFSATTNAGDFGNATASDVAKGKTFTSYNGLKLTGTHECSSGTLNLQEKTVTPTKSSQSISPDSNYDGLSSVTVNPIPDNYIDTSDTDATSSDIASGKTAYVNGQKITGSISVIPKNGTNPVDDCPVDTVSGKLRLKVQESTDRIYRSGATIEARTAFSNFGDATASDVAKGKTFTSSAGLKVTGTAEATPSDDNCESYQITSASEALNFKRTDGTIKVWGYGFKSSGTYQKTVYAFCGDGYYTGSSYMNPTKTSVSWSLNADGTLSGLPSGLTALDVLVTKGI